MNIDRQTVQAALDALMKLPNVNSVEEYGTNFEIVESFLRDALAQPEQAEPVAWFRRDQLQHIGGGELVSAYPNTDNRTDLVPLYAIHQQPTSAKLLTNEQLDALANKHLRHQEESHGVSGVYDFARAVLAAKDSK